jgi:hypothetical protein
MVHAYECMTDSLQSCVKYDILTYTTAVLMYLKYFVLTSLLGTVAIYSVQPKEET